MTEPRPLREADLSRVEAVFTDVDGTLTTGGRLRASTLSALERLERDASLFADFPLSVGVANVRAVLGLLAHRPRFVTRAPEGGGFEELARPVLRTRGGWR